MRLLGVVGDTNQIIIKRVKKVSGDGHHGGAWKVAYADFVTAMMAFFLLMWLLNATTEDQRKGIADYFNPTIPVSPISGGGADLLNGSTVFSDKTLAKDGTGGAKNFQNAAKTQSQENEESDANKLPETDPDTAETLAMEQIKEQNQSLEEVREDLLQQVAGEQAERLARHIQMRVTPEGLLIELVDVDGSPLFEVGSTRASATMKLLLQVVTASLAPVENEISIVGHTDALAFSGVKNYTNWELSTDRAHMARRLMIENGLPINQINEIAGKADSEPLVEDKFAPQNRRISITILKS